MGRRRAGSASRAWPLTWRTSALKHHCAIEHGDDGQQPLQAFYRVKAARYAGGYRYSSYCRRHTKARNLQVRNNAGEGTALCPAMRRANKAYADTHSEQNRAAVARHRTRKKAHEDP